MKQLKLLLVAGVPLFEGITEGAVECRAEVNKLFAGLEAFEHVVLNFKLVVINLGGLDGQSDAVFNRIHLHNAGFNAVADVQDILNALYVFIRNLADVYEAVDAFLDFNECAERGILVMMPLTLAPIG